MSDSSHCQLLFSLSLSSRAFLNMHALHFFVHHFQKSNGCPLLLPLFSSATLLYLWLTQFPGRIHPAVWRLEQGNVLQTDRHNRHTSQLALMPLLCPVECPPTLMRIASVSSFLSQTRLLFLLFARDGWRSGRIYCTLHTSCCSTILFTVRFILMKEPQTLLDGDRYCLIHSSYTCREKKNNWQFHHGQKSGFSHILPQESRDADCVFIWPRRDIMTWSISAKCIWKTEKDLFRRDWMPQY